MFVLLVFSFVFCSFLTGLLYPAPQLAAVCVCNCVEREADRKVAAELMNLDESLISDLTELLSEGRY